MAMVNSTDLFMFFCLNEVEGEVVFERIIVNSTPLVSCFCSVCFVLRVREVMVEKIILKSSPPSFFVFAS